MIKKEQQKKLPLLRVTMRYVLCDIDYQNCSLCLRGGFFFGAIEGN